MAISPGIYNFSIRRRSDHTEHFVFCDDSGNSLDLTGWSADAEGWLKGRTQKLFDFTVDVSSLDQGFVRITAPKEITETLPNELEYDVLLTNPEGVKEYYIAGTIIVTEGYTT